MLSTHWYTGSRAKCIRASRWRPRLTKGLSGKNGNERIVSITIITITITIIIVMIIFVESSGPPVEVEVGNTQALGLILVWWSGPTMQQWHCSPVYVLSDFDSLAVSLAWWLLIVALFCSITLILALKCIFILQCSAQLHFWNAVHC